MYVSEKPVLKYRHELKHLANEAQADMLSKRLACLFPRDKNAGEHGRYYVTSVYFEDPFDLALRQKIEGIDRREKFRLRYYGSDTSFVKLERKIKYKGLCSKQSARLSTEDVRHILNGEYGFLLDRNDPVCVDFYSKLQGNILRPRVVVRYEREAFSYFPGNVRVTIDRGLRTSLNAIDFLTPFSGRVPVTDGAVVVEVKFDEFLPEVVQLALAPLGQQARAYSKYAFCRRLD